MNPKSITVALVEDEPATHARLCAALKAAPNIQLVFAAKAAIPMLAWLGAHSVDVLLVDLGLPDLPGFDVIRRCKVIRPNTEVMVVTMFGDEANMIRAFESGARGYLLKDASEDELAEHVQSLHAGGSPMSPIIARQLLSRMSLPAVAAPTFLEQSVRAANAAPPSDPNGRDPGERALTDREVKVLQHLAKGYSYAELAKQLGVTINTIQTHVRGLYSKLDVHSKSEAIFEAKQLGLLSK